MAWKEIGRSVLSPTSNKIRKEVLVDIERYVLTVGFEANYIDTAFKGNVQDLDVDYGHAFFYVTKNDEVIVFFSFGPNGIGSKGKSSEARHGTPDYPIGEVARLFRLIITAAQAKNLVKETNKMRENIENGKQKYTAYINDTCAETAKQVIDKTNIQTPSGAGKIHAMGHTTFFTAVNPYMWHHDFKQAGYKEIVYPQRTIEKLVKPDPANNINPMTIESDNIHFYCDTSIEDPSSWSLKVGVKDPLVAKRYISATGNE